MRQGFFAEFLLSCFNFPVCLLLDIAFFKILIYTNQKIVDFVEIISAIKIYSKLKLLTISLDIPLINIGF